MGLAVTVMFLAVAASAAQAAPSFEVGLSHSPLTLALSDRSLTYTVTARNDSEADAVNVGDEVSCNGIESTTGLSKNWFPGAPGDPTHPSYSFEWTRNGVPIAGAVGQVYTVGAADEGAVLQCLVRGANATGGAKFASLPGIVVKPRLSDAPPETTNRTAAASRPAVSGTGTAMRTCSTAAMNWVEDLDGDPETAPTPLAAPFAFRWLRNGVDIPGATGDTYTPAIATGTATRVVGSTTLTGVSTSTGTFAVGDVVTGTGIPTTAPTIVSIGADTIELSTAATTSGSGAITGGADNVKQLQCQVIGSNAGGSLVGISNHSAVGTVPDQVNLAVAQNPEIELGNTTSGTVTATLVLPSGTTTYSVSATGWSCSSASGPVNEVLTCTRSNLLAPQVALPDITVQTAITGEVSNPATATATVSGGGALSSATAEHVVNFSPFVPFGLVPGSFVARAVDQVGDDVTQAGAHPFAGDASFELTVRRDTTGRYRGVEDLRDVITDLPPGFVGNPSAATTCTVVDAYRTRFTSPVCPASSIVGSVDLTGSSIGTKQVGQVGMPDTAPGLPLYLVRPDRGVAAQFTFVLPTPGGQFQFVLQAKPRAESQYAVRISAPAVAKSAQVSGVKVRLCSYGVNLVDGFGIILNDNGIAHVTGCKASGDPGALDRPLLTNQTSCPAEPPVTKLAVNSWSQPDLFHRAEAVAPAMTGCDQVPFTPEVAVAPTATTADGASGLAADVSIPDDGLNDPNGISQAHLKKTVVRLPEGVSVNPSVATGLGACSDAQLGLGNDDEPLCPDSSKIGTVTATTPLLEETLSGVMVLRSPESTDPMSGEMLRMALIVRNDERGVLVKLPGSATADPQTGRLTATFDDNPQLPIGNVHVELRGGDRGVLGLPQRCNTEPDQYESVSSFTPWSRSHLPEGEGDGTQDPVEIRQSWTVDGDCSYGFDPGLKAGMSNAGAREGGTFGFEFTRPQGDQTLKGLTAELPTGLLATVKDLPLCKDAQAAAGNCPAASRIGLVDASAGSGDPFVLEKKGEIFLTEGYKGGAYGLMVKVRAIAGPFRGAMELSPIIVRQKIEVDPTTAQVKAISDPFPTIWHGVPLRVRRVLVKIDRDNFMVNPSDCSAKQVRASLTSSEGTRADLANHFQARGCAALPFKPRIRMQNMDKGRRSTLRSWNPRMRFVVRQQGVGEAGISGARVTLPSSVILDQSNLDTTCTRAQMAAEDCPAGSVVGYARAFSPLLNRPVQGPVYLAANGGVRPLPDVVAVLDGEIRVALTSWIDTVRRGGKGRLRSTFNVVPDAPVTRFVLTMRGGKHRGLLVNSTDLCRTNERAVANFSGHNGKRSSSRPRIGLRFKGCKRARKQIARRAAKRKIAKEKARQARAAHARASSKD